MIRQILCLIILSGSLALGQLTSNSVLVTASNNATLAPDQIVFDVNVNAPITASLDDVLAALAGSGITQASLSGATNQEIIDTLTSVPPQPPVSWNFTLPVPFAQLKATVATLNGLQNSIAAKNNGMQMSFSVQGPQISTQLQQSQTCSMTSLLTAARASAQTLVTAAGLMLGNVLAMSSPAPASSCSLTVMFQLMR